MVFSLCTAKRPGLNPKMVLVKADFGPNDVHKQYGITVRTPPYADMDITEPVLCAMFLYRPKNNTKSDPIDFYYVPSNHNLVRATVLLPL